MGDIKEPDSNALGIKNPLRPRFNSSSAMPGRLTEGKEITVGENTGGNPMKSKVTPNSIIASIDKSDIIAPQACRQCLTFPAFPAAMGREEILLTEVSCIPTLQGHRATGALGGYLFHLGGGHVYGLGYARWQN